MITRFKDDAMSSCVSGSMWTALYGKRSTPIITRMEVRLERVCDFGAFAHTQPWTFRCFSLIRYAAWSTINLLSVSVELELAVEALAPGSGRNFEWADDFGKGARTQIKCNQQDIQGSSMSDMGWPAPGHQHCRLCYPDSCIVMVDGCGRQLRSFQSS